MIQLCYQVLEKSSIVQRLHDIFLGLNKRFYFVCQIKRILSIENSDQTDPFNRNPLRMQDVIPQEELKQTIEQWKASQRG